MQIKNLVISGGSVRSIAVIGCLQYLFDECGGIAALDGMVNVVGTSAGALVALMLVMGYRPMEMKMAMKDVLLNKGYHRLGFDDLLELRMFDSFGMDSGAAVDALIADLFAYKGYDPNTTFLELAKKSGKNLVICVANLSRERSEYKCVDESPHLSVATAIRMSVSLPILFAPVCHDGELFVDGGLYESLPLGYISSKFKDSLRDTLAIRTTPTPTSTKTKTMETGTKINNIVDYFNVMISSLLTKANDAATARALSTSMSKVTIFEVSPPEENECIDVDVVAEAEGNLFGFDMSEMNFCISDESIDRAVANGYASFAAFFTDKD